MTQHYQTISATEFCEQWLHHPDTMVIDVRSPAEVRQKSLEKSVNLPFDAVSGHSVETLIEKHASADTPKVFLLCHSGKRAEMAAKKLAGSIDHSLTIVTGGIEAVSGESVKLKAAAQGRKVISLERQVRIAAGTLVLAGTACGALFNPYFYLVPATIGAGLVFAGISDTCGMGLMLARMPWNR